jgi:hypothetical protein
MIRIECRSNSPENSKLMIHSSICYFLNRKRLAFTWPAFVVSGEQSLQLSLRDVGLREVDLRMHVEAVAIAFYLLQLGASNGSKFPPATEMRLAGSGISSAY